MTCAGFERWLDEGMPARDAASADAHVRGCARCAAALEAARAIEAVLSREAPDAPAVSVRAPATLAPDVMARVRALEAARARGIEEAPAPRWWLGLLSDPVATVSITVALLTLALLLWNPVRVLRLGGWAGAKWLAWIASAGEAPVDPIVWLALAAAAAPFALWWVWQIGRMVERALVLQVTRPARDGIPEA